MFRKPDLHAKRFRPRRITTQHHQYCQQFREDHKKVSKRAAALTDAEIKEILALYHQAVIEQVSANRDGVLIQDRLGLLFITACPPKKSANINFAQSIAQNRRVVHQNLHTDGLLCKITYINSLSRNSFANRELWGFKPVREFKHYASGQFTQNYNLYRKADYLASSLQSLRDRQSRRANYVIQKKLETYDELSI